MEFKLWIIKRPICLYIYSVECILLTYVMVEAYSTFIAEPLSILLLIYYYHFIIIIFIIKLYGMKLV